MADEEPAAAAPEEGGEGEGAAQVEEVEMSVLEALKEVRILLCVDWMCIARCGTETAQVLEYRNESSHVCCFCFVVQVLQKAMIHCVEEWQAFRTLLSWGFFEES